jgi:hypothetical protein
MKRDRELTIYQYVFVVAMLSIGAAMLVALVTSRPTPRTRDRFSEEFEQVQTIRKEITERVRKIPLERVRPEPYQPPPAPAPPPAPLPPPAPEPPQAAQEVEPPTTHQPERSDICAKYGGHRVDYGKHWRCVYGDRNGRRRR